MAMKRALKWGVFLAAALVFLGGGGARAAGPLSMPGADSKEPLEIVADRLVTNDAEKFAEFSGRVKATQGKFTLTADTLRIYYEGDLVNAPKGERSGREAIKRIVAGGKVHIVSEEYSADAERAEYLPESDELTLAGPGSRVVSGKNTLSGAKIIYNRSQGKALVEGGGGERVKAVFYQEEKENAPEAKKAGAKPPAPKN
jgi:lipopolysaccharide transport protein LptA